MSSSSSNGGGGGGGGGGGMKRSDSVQQLRDMANNFTSRIAGLFNLSPTKERASSSINVVSTDPMASADSDFPPMKKSARQRFRSGSCSNSSGNDSNSPQTRSKLASKTPDMKPKKSKIGSKIAKLRLPLLGNHGNNSNNSNSSSNNNNHNTNSNMLGHVGTAVSGKSPTSPFPAPATNYPCTSRMLSTSISNRSGVTSIASSSHMGSGESTPTVVGKGGAFSSSSDSSPGDGKPRHGRVSCAIGRAVAKLHRHQQHLQPSVPSVRSSKHETDDCCFTCSCYLAVAENDYYGSHVCSTCQHPTACSELRRACECRHHSGLAAQDAAILPLLLVLLRQANKDEDSFNSYKHANYCCHLRSVVRLASLDLIRRLCPPMERTIVTYDIELSGLPKALTKTTTMTVATTTTTTTPPDGSDEQKSGYTTTPSGQGRRKAAAQSQLLTSLLSFVKCPEQLPDYLFFKQGSHSGSSSLFTGLLFFFLLFTHLPLPT